MLVTDITRVITLKNGKETRVEGFYMDRYLKQNLDSIPNYLSKEWDVVGIVSGHGLVGTGKSTFASQIAFYVAWLLAGGRVYSDEKGNTIRVTKPSKQLNFSLKENVVFSAEDLQNKAKELHDRYGKNQVIVYDEGRQGLDSARAMESINKGMEDFFQECRLYGHVIIIVLPNFFKLHEDYAVARSLFLIDCFVDKNLKRGYFNFYNTKQKEYLFFFGKKRIGVTAKYSAANESFWGKFTKWIPYDKKEYDLAKKRALEKKRMERGGKRIRLQRDILVWYLSNRYKVTPKEIKEQFSEIGGIDMDEKTVENIVSMTNGLKFTKLAS